MAQQTINIGTTPNDGTGDPARTAFTKVNENFTELYSRSEYGSRNHIANGEMYINRYSDIDSAPIAVSEGVYYIDRYLTKRNTVTATLQRLSDQLVDGAYVKTIKYLATSTGTGLLGCEQRLEVVYRGEVKSFGVWVRSNSSNARAIVYTGVAHYSSSPHTGGGGFEFLKIEGLTIDASATVLYARVLISDSSSSTVSITSGDYIESTFWQLEPGTTCSKYVRKMPEDYLPACQRFLPYAEGRESFFTYGEGFATSSTTAIIRLKLEATARIDPININPVGNFRLTDGVTGTAVTGIALGASSTYGKNTVSVVVTVASGLTQFRPYYLSSDGDATAYIEIQTEL